MCIERFYKLILNISYTLVRLLIAILRLIRNINFLTKESNYNLEPFSLNIISSFHYCRNDGIFQPIYGYIYPLLLKVLLWSFMFADLAIKKPYSFCLWYLIPQSVYTQEKYKKNRPVLEHGVSISSLCMFAYKHRLEATEKLQSNIKVSYKFY